MASDEGLIVFRENFNEKVSAFLSSKRTDNNVFLTADKYDVVLRQVKEGKVKKKKETQDYRRLKRYDILLVGGQEKLIQPMTNATKKVKYYVKNEELFDVIHSTHIAIGHGGRNRMMHELKTKYCNVTKETIMAYLSHCEQCQNKQHSVIKKLNKLMSNPCLSNRHLKSRCRIDFIEMKSQSERSECRFILVYQDDSTKFVILRALKSNSCVLEIASHLVDIFTTFGAPMIVETEHGRQFAIHLIEQIGLLWKDMKLVTSYNTSSNRSGGGGGMRMKRTNGDIVNMLVAWMNDNRTTDWEMGLKFVQFMKNRAFHEGIKRSPYEAMFGCEAKVGLESSSLPREVLANVKTEQDFIQVLGQNIIEVECNPSMTSLTVFH